MLNKKKYNKKVFMKLRISCKAYFFMNCQLFTVSAPYHYESKGIDFYVKVIKINVLKLLKRVDFYS